MSVVDMIEELIEQGYSEEEAQFIAADRLFGEIYYKEQKVA